MVFEKACEHDPVVRLDLIVDALTHAAELLELRLD